MAIVPRLRRGSLDILPGLPLDVLGEIFCCLDPSDLLVLIRTSRAFRSFLLGNSTVFIWKYARQNVAGLPEPPPDMNEIQYASLVLGSRCYYEGCDRKARDTVWHLRFRSCAGCRPKHEPVKPEYCADYLAVVGTLGCLPSNLEQYIPCGPFLNSKGKSVKGFRACDIKAFRDELNSLPLSEYETFLNRRKQLTEVVNQFASEGVKWQQNMKNLRLTEMRNKRAARAEIIRECLMATSFRDEIDYFGWERIRKHPFITSTQEMTDQARCSVLDHLREHLLGWRELRMEEQVYSTRRQVFVDVWHRYTTTFFYNSPSNSPYLPLPPSTTIGLSERIDAIIRQPTSTSDSDDSLLRQFYDALPPACDDIPGWHRTIRRELASLLPGYRAEDSDQAIHTQLKLATSVFQCTFGRNCQADSHTLTYPEILFHPCFTLVAPEHGSSSKDPRVVAYQQACSAMGSNPWSCRGRVRVHLKHHVWTTVVQHCGRDPGTTTATEMDMQDFKLACLACYTHDKVIHFFDWRLAVQHYITSHCNSPLKCPWFVIKRTSQRSRLDVVQPLDLTLLSSSYKKLRDYSVCLRCPPRIPSWKTRFGFGELINHIRQLHGIASPAFGKDYMFDTNVTPLYLYLDPSPIIG